MIFSNCPIATLPFVPKIKNHEIERKYSARFLGVIINDKLTWKDHTLAVKAKMSRYVGVLFKLKKFLPLSARKNIFHSFIQSHLHYCSLVWGLGAKSYIEPLFAEQKKAIRSLMPGYNSNYYKNGMAPCHTKAFFTEHNIPTLPSIILSNIIIFMNNLHNRKNCLPSSVANIISPCAPKPSEINENCVSWLNMNSTLKLRNTLSFKGPLFFAKYMLEISRHCRTNKELNLPIDLFKKQTKSFVFKLQSGGRCEEWEGKNTPLYYVPGLPRICRKNATEVSYIYE